jgi:hypothetical protein
VRFFRILWSILKELGDENAYQRHLRIHQKQHSAKEYRLFQQEHFRAKYQRAKCC